MTGAYGVDVEALHDLDILYHAFLGQEIASVRIHLVTVGALDQHRLAVNEELRALDLHFAEANLLGNDLNNVSLRILDDGKKGIEIGCLCGPLLHVSYDKSCRTIVHAFEVASGLAHQQVVLIE